MKHRIFVLTIISLFLLGVTATWAGSYTIPNTFNSGTPAVASEVNANFGAAKAAIDDNDTRISSLETGSGSITIPAVAFRGQFNSDSFYRNENNGFVYRMSTVGIGRLFAPVILPVGATITGIKGFVFDDENTALISIALKKGASTGADVTLTTIASIATTDANVARYQVLEDLTLSEIVASGPLNFYFIEAQMTAARLTLGFFSVTVEYTY